MWNYIFQCHKRFKRELQDAYMESWQSCLWCSIAESDVGGMRRILHSVDVNAKYHGLTPLMWAMINNNEFAIVRALLAIPSVKLNVGSSAMHNGRWDLWRDWTAYDFAVSFSYREKAIAAIIQDPRFDVNSILPPTWGERPRCTMRVFR